MDFLASSRKQLINNFEQFRTNLWSRREFFGSFFENIWPAAHSVVRFVMKFHIYKMTIQGKVATIYLLAIGSLYIFLELFDIGLLNGKSLNQFLFVILIFLSFPLGLIGMPLIIVSYPHNSSMEETLLQVVVASISYILNGYLLGFGISRLKKFKKSKT